MNMIIKFKDEIRKIDSIKVNSDTKHIFISVKYDHENFNLIKFECENLEDKITKIQSFIIANINTQEVIDLDIVLRGLGIVGV